MTPYAAAIFMMRRGADPELIAAYVVEEARRAGCDPLDLAPKSTMENLAAAFGKIRDAFMVLRPAILDVHRAMVTSVNTPPPGGPPSRRGYSADWVLFDEAQNLKKGGPMTGDWEVGLTDAVEAASAEVWNKVHGEAMGEWPGGCPDPDEFRAEEREALMPALRVLRDRGWLRG